MEKLSSVGSILDKIKIIMNLSNNSTKGTIEGDGNTITDLAASPGNKSLLSSEKLYRGKAFTLSSDGLFLYYACEDKIKIVNLSNNKTEGTIKGDGNTITALAVSPDNERLLSSSLGLQISVWDLSSLTCLRSFTLKFPVLRMAFSARGRSIALTGADNRVFIRRCHSVGYYVTHRLEGHKDAVTSILFHPDPKQYLLFTGSEDGTIRAWDLVSKYCVAVLEKHSSAVTSLAISKDGWTLLSAGRDEVVNVWDVRNFTFNFSTTIPVNEVIETVCVISSGTPMAALLGPIEQCSEKRSPIYFLTVGEHGIIRIWNSQSAVSLFEYQPFDARVSSEDDGSLTGFTAAAILPSDQELLCVTADMQFLFYCPMQSVQGEHHLRLNKRLEGYNEEEIVVMELGSTDMDTDTDTDTCQTYQHDKSKKIQECVCPGSVRHGYADLGEVSLLQSYGDMKI